MESLKNGFRAGLSMKNASAERRAAAPQCWYSERSDPLKPVKNVGIDLVHLFNRLVSVFERPTPADVRLISQKRVSDGIGVDGNLLFRL